MKYLNPEKVHIESVPSNQFRHSHMLRQKNDFKTSIITVSLRHANLVATAIFSMLLTDL